MMRSDPQRSSINRKTTMSPFLETSLDEVSPQSNLKANKLENPLETRKITKIEANHQTKTTQKRVSNLTDLKTSEPKNLLEITPPIT